MGGGVVLSRPVRILVLVLELFLQLALFLGRLARVLGRRWRVEVDLVIHRDLL
ncbi:hypothetical protein [Mycobacterium sp.]|uniref:hypothetical protein n=1 Tax=Mycobacterium sp. TaxID=1785 RepID=UPI003F7D40E2